MIFFFEKNNVIHFCLRKPTERTGVVDTFCGQDYSTVEGYFYTSVVESSRDNICGDCFMRTTRFARSVGAI
jgi:hypothetical protein